jgi:hypothetical protein
VSVMRPASAQRQMRSSFCDSGRMVWFGIGISESGEMLVAPSSMTYSLTES